jgi:hypothetical protein
LYYPLAICTKLFQVNIHQARAGFFHHPRVGACHHAPVSVHLPLMQFHLSISNGTLTYHLHIEKISSCTSFETFKVTPKQNPDKYIIIQNNRPLLRIKYKLKTKPLNWVLLEGTVNNQRNYEKLIKSIEEILEPKEVKSKPLFFQPHHPSNRKKRPKGGTTLGDRQH